MNRLRLMHDVFDNVCQKYLDLALNIDSLEHTLL